MKKNLLAVVLAGFSFFSKAQTVTYNFATNPLSAGWTSVVSGATMGAGFTYDGTNQNIDYNIQTEIGTQLMHRATPYTLGDQFSASFKIHTSTNQNNTFFPLMLTPSQVTGVNNHPWRLNPNGTTIGALQNIDLLGVVIVNSHVRLLNRDGNSASGITAYTLAYTLANNTDYWIKLERICATSVRLTVFSNAAMTTILKDQYFTIPNLDPMNHMYIANCNGNATTNLSGELDDYTISLPNNTCCSPSQINGDNVICNPSTSSTFTADISGNNIQNPNWTISPSGPVFTQSTSGGYSMNVSNWVQPGTYTITFTWTCNCITNTLTKTVIVQEPIGNIDYVSLASNCTEVPNTHGFTSTANGTNTSITRYWEIYLAANSISGDYTTASSTPIATYGNVTSVSMSSLPNTNAYVIKCYHSYANGVCPVEVVNRKSICASAKMTTSTTQHDKPVVYPNPAQKEVNIQLPSRNTVENIQLVDMNGKILITSEVSPEDVSISLNLDKLIDGVYTIVFIGKEAYKPERFVKN